MNEIITKLKERLDKNSINLENEFRHELREITQELVMAGLSKTDFFSKASFHGGTALRILYGINRYSEDLDFTLEKPNNLFKWQPYLYDIKEFVAQYGCKLEVIDKSKDNVSVKKAFVKDHSIEQMMNLSWMRKSGTPEKVRIKMELDSNPPLYSICEMKTHNCLIDFNIKVHDLPSLFAGKCHALLCREYEKGRDWFDLQWFVNRGIEPNYQYLDAMLNQQGVWKGQNINTNKVWIIDNLVKKGNSLNFDDINNDIMKFTNEKSRIIFNAKLLNNIIDKIGENNYGQGKKSRISDRK